MQNASQKMHFFHSYLLTKKDEGDSQMKRMKRKCRARLDFHFIKTKDQFVCHKLYIKAVEGVGKLYNYTMNLLIPRIMRYEDIRAFLPIKNQLSGNRNFNTT